MEGRLTGKVRLEFVPWLNQPLGHKGSARLIVDEEIDHELTMVDLLSALATKYPAVGTAIINFGTGQLFDHVNVVYNGTMLASIAAPEQRIAPGDSLVFLPAFVGG